MSHLPTTPTPPNKPKPEEPDRSLYNEARQKRTPLTFHMRGRQQITGIVRSFGVFSVEIETSAGRMMLYKHAVDLVAAADAPAPRNARPGAAASPAATGAMRPPMGGAR